MVIYKITNNVNGKFYIGKTKNYSENYYGSGKVIKFAIKKYGKDKFTKEVLEKCSTLEQLNEREKYWIDKLDAISNGYNLAEGGEGGKTTKIPWNKGLKGAQKAWNKGIKTGPQSEELKRKRSNALKGKNRYKKTEEHKKKLSDALKGILLPESTKQKMRGKHKGIQQKKITCPHCGKSGGNTMYRWHFDNCKEKNNG